MRRLALLLAFSSPACVNQEAADYAFCEPDEACFSIVEPELVVCGGIACDDGCHVGYYCGDSGECRAQGYTADWDDNNACTKDECIDGGWRHTPLDPKSYDDGDPCTVDQCSPGLGISHTNTCG